MLTETRVGGEVKLHGLMASFGQPEELLMAAHRAYAAGYRQMDAYSPMPIEGLADAIGFRSNAVSRWVFVGGLFGAAGGFGLMWWISVIAYPHNVAGRPLNSWIAYIPITFETTVLLTSLSIFFGLLILMRLPQPYHAVFELEAFRSAVTDGFWLSVAQPAGSDGKEAARELESAGASQVSVVKESVE